MHNRASDYEDYASADIIAPLISKKKTLYSNKDVLKGALIICANDKALRSIYRGHHRASNSNQRVTQMI